MTFSEAFYGTYKLDKKDGKPHLKERIFAPVDGFWSGVMIFGGVVGTIILLLTFAAHVQVALGTFAHPAENGALTPDAQYTLWGVLVAFIFAFFVLAIPLVPLPRHHAVQLHRRISHPARGAAHLRVQPE